MSRASGCLTELEWSGDLTEKEQHTLKSQRPPLRGSPPVFRQDHLCVSCNRSCMVMIFSSVILMQTHTGWPRSSPTLRRGLAWWLRFRRKLHTNSPQSRLTEMHHGSTADITEARRLRWVLGKFSKYSTHLLIWWKSTEEMQRKKVSI